jgi:zinc transporter ZupT
VSPRAISCQALPVILALTLLTVATTLAGGMLGLRLERHIESVMAFAAGIVIAAATLDLLPEAIERAKVPGQVGAFVLAGMLWFFLFGRLVARRDERHANDAGLGGLQAAMLCFHSLQDGIGIGLAFSASRAVGILVLAAVVAHDLADGMNTVTFVLGHHGSRRAARAWLLADALAPLLGVAVALLARPARHVLDDALAVFAGIFLMMGAGELLPRAHRRPSLARVGLTLAGVALMSIVTAVLRR